MGGILKKIALAIALAAVATALPNASAGTVEDAPEALLSGSEDMLHAELDGVPPATGSSPKCSLRLRWHVGIPQVKAPGALYYIYARDEAEVVGTCVSDAPIDATPVVKITFEYFDSRTGVQAWKEIAVRPRCEDASQAGRQAQVLPCRAWDEYPPTWNEELQRAEDHESVGYWHRARFEMISPIRLGPL